MPVEVFTSYHAKAEKLNEMGFAVISISVGFPKFGRVEWYAGKMPELAPTRDMLNLDTDAYYKRFDKILSRTTAEKCLETMERIAAHAGTDKVALLCFEANRNECHRSYVGEWLEEQLNIQVKEVEFTKPMNEIKKPKPPMQFSLF